jgi:methylmalonyl-CoA mutase
MKKEGNRRLFTMFPEITTAQWEEKIMNDLKGADYQRKLMWRTDEGVHVKPYYRSEDLEGLDYLNPLGQLKDTSKSPNQWIICQDIFPGNEPGMANSRILDALKGGAETIRIHLEDSPVPDVEMLRTLLEGVSLGETEILFRGSLMADAVYQQYCNLAQDKGVAKEELRGSPGADPFGKMARSGIPIASLENLARLVKKVKQDSPAMRVIDVNGCLFQNSGSNLVEELAFTFAMANEYLALLTSKGIDPVDAFSTIQLNLAAGSNYFFEVAKIRAARILWGKICEGYGIDPAEGKARIHSTSSEWNMTLYDPNVNMLRGTTEAMSAIIGGADLVTVLPFDYPYGKSTDFSDRIARNIQMILREEAYFDRVSDPASGSYYIESLTDEIGERAWDLFRETEAKGGFMKAFESGWIQEMVAQSRAKKLERAATGRDRILGTNAYPDFNEMILENLGQKKEQEKNESGITPLIPFRPSGLFEEVRLATEQSGKRPRVFLFKYGNPAWVAARAVFSGNFFACAGYEILDHQAFNSITEGIVAVNEADPDMVVLCSSDDAYVSIVHEISGALNHRSILVVAGYPKDSMEVLKNAGVEHYIHMQSNLLDSLKTFNKLLL